MAYFVGDCDYDDNDDKVNNAPCTEYPLFLVDLIMEKLRHSINDIDGKCFF